jgi:hypothetical protein
MNLSRADPVLEPSDEKRKRPRSSSSSLPQAAATPPLAPTRDRQADPIPMLLFDAEEVCTRMGGSCTLSTSADKEESVVDAPAPVREATPAACVCRRRSAERQTAGAAVPRTPPRSPLPLTRFSQSLGSATPPRQRNGSSRERCETAAKKAVNSGPDEESRKPSPAPPPGFKHKRTAVDDYLLPNTIIILVTSLSGRFLSVEVHPQRSIAELRLKLETLVGIPRTCQRLHLNGCAVPLPAHGDPGAGQTLTAAGFKDLCTVHVLAALAPPPTPPRRKTPSGSETTAVRAESPCHTAQLTRHSAGPPARRDQLPLGAAEPSSPPPSPFRSPGRAQTMGDSQLWRLAVPSKYAAQNTRER